jgi:anti-anti-sigma factor
MSLTVAFPDFSATRERGAGQEFVCTMQAGDVSPVWVHVAGKLDIRSAPRLERALRHADNRSCLVVLDLRELTFIDSCGVHVIVEASIDAQLAKRRLMLVRGPLRVDRMLARSPASDVLDIVELDPGESFTRAVPQFTLTDDAA